MGYAAMLVSAGIVLGLGAAWGAASLASRFLIVSPTDPLVYVLVPLALTAAALLACAVPAWKAARTAPVVALRLE